MNDNTMTRFTILLVLALGSACQGQTVHQPEAAPSGWKTHRDPSGFSLQVPEGWTVSADGSSGKILIAGEQGRLTIWPTRIPGSLDQRRAAYVQSALLRQAEGSRAFQAPQAVTPSTLRAVRKTAEEQSIALLSWSPAGTGTAATLYVVSCPPRLTPEIVEIFDRVLKNFTVTAKAESSRAETLDYVRFNDPTEGAFSVDVPSQWTVQGGVQRPNSLIAQARVEVYSPDRETFLYLGDAFPVFIEPNQFLGAGQTYYDPMGTANPVQYYQPGTAFVKNFLLPQRLGQFEIVSERERPDITSQMRRLAISEYHAGEIVYRFNDGQSMGIAVCITERLSMGSGFGSWHVYRMAVAESSAASFGEAVAAGSRLAASFRISPQWSMMEARRAGTNSQIIADMNRVISDSIVSGFENRSRSMDAVMARDARARRGIEEVYDPLTGERFEVESGRNFYWVDPRGNRVGTDTFARPNIDFRQLLILR